MMIKQPTMACQQTPNQTLIGNEKNAMSYTSRLVLCLLLLRHHVLHPKPYFFHYFLQRLPKLAVAAWSCLVVASKLGLMAQAKVLVGARSSFWSHQFISNVLEYIHVDGVDDISAY
jgi:hypothetical protein